MQMMASLFDEPTTAAPPPAAAGDAKLATRFLGWAEALDPKIEHAGRPMTQNPTPKRNREYQSRMIDYRNLDRTQKALRVLAEAHAAGSVPQLLANLKTKYEISRLVHKSVSGEGGYYSAIESKDYSQTGPAARLLQEMIDVPAPQRAERDRKRKIEELEAGVKLMTIPGYFPTPAAVVAMMLERARLQTTMTVLEPSAGSGNIADAIRAAHPGVVVQVIEQVYTLREILRLKGYELVGEDFMQVSAAELGTFDRVIMNPPFEKQQDLDHVRRAFSLLKPDGILVAIMSPSFEFRSDRKSVEFREWLDSLSAQWDMLTAGSFKASGTGVSTRIVTIER